MALGGVATGSINAKLDAMTSGMAIDMGATEIATAMDVAMGHLLHQTTGSGVTLEINVKYLSPIIGGNITCKGSFLRKGKSISFLQAHMYKEDGKIAAYASATWKPLDI